MKNYKEFDMECIGSSDIACVILVGFRKDEGLICEPLHFGRDGSYCAYVCKGDVEIGAHYKLIGEFNSWLKVYDDTKLVKEYEGSVIRVYRAAEMGCIIHIL
jgi:hypothetical protein